uniref:Aberrant root formation protein 4 n=1 Tax=Manihot esculenta TaxID=3983 RepID=A0A2C9W4Z4_MANES
MSAETTQLRESPSIHRLVLRLQEILCSCSKSIEGGDGSSVSELVDFLETVSGSALENPEDEVAQNNALEILSEIQTFLLSATLDQEVIDALSFELPKVASKFAGLSSRCLEIADGIIDHFIAKCSPRDMLSILCGALSATDRPIYSSGYVASILRGLSKVFISLQRRHFEQMKVAIPIILNVLKAACSELGDEDTEDLNLFHRAIGIADSIRAVCAKFEGRINEKFHALLGLYVLQVMALVSFSAGHKVSNCLPLVSQLSNFLPYCDLSYLGLITGSDVDAATNIIIEEVEDDFMSCLSYVKHGASLSVIWGYIYDDVAQAAGGDMSFVRGELQSNQTNRWQAVGMLKHILASTDVLWELKKHAINFLLCITNGNGTRNDGLTDCSIFLPSLCAASQAITKVIIYAPNTELRKNAYEALKRVLADTPTSERFDILTALLTTSDSSSMILLEVSCTWKVCRECP